MSVSIFVQDEGKELQVYDSLDALSRAAADSLVWVDIETDSADELGQVAEHFGLHELTVEDCLTPGHFPKMEEFGSYIFLVLRALKPWADIEDMWLDLEPKRGRSSHQTISDRPTGDNEDEDERFTRKVGLYLSEKFVVTFRRKPLPWLDALVRQVSQNTDRLQALGADGLAHRVVDVLVDRFWRGLDFFETIIEEIEDQTVENPREFEMASVLALKRILVGLRQIARDQRSVVAKLAAESSLPIRKQQRRYFKDIDDHAMDILNVIDKLLDTLSSVRDAYFASANVRLGDIMRILAIITTIAAPLNLVVGLYGMNFEFMPLIHHSLGFFLVVGLILLLTLAMIVYFRRKRWL